MTRGRSMWLAPALLGAFWMAKNRSGSRSGRGMLSQFAQGRSRGWMGQSRGGWGQSIGTSILQSLFGGGRRRSSYGLFR